MDKLKNKYLLFFLTGLLLGLIIGVTLINILVSYRIDSYIKKIQYLNTVIEDNNVKLEKLKEAINKNRLIVKDIEVELEFQDENVKDDIVKINLQKHIKKKLKGLLGKEVDKIDGEILFEVIDKRIMKLDGKEYKLKVERILIADKVKLWVKASILK